MARFLPSVGTISNVHGRVFKKADQLYMTLYHPAAALHQNRLKSTIEADFRKIPQVLKKIKE
jgi:uracil-DNA glycosylase family 4